MFSSSGEAEETKYEMKATNPSSQSQERNNNPGVRVIQNGTTCHQCRHKIYGVYAKCKNQAKTKPCIIKYCRTCLLNRYGEKVEDVLLEKWDCPRCKGVCNCSICMKKRGHQPTGMVTQMAKAGRFSSVLDMIVAKGAQNVSKYKRVKETTASPRKLSAPVEGINDISVPNKMKRKGLEVKLDGSGVSDVSVTEINALDESNQKKLKSKGSKEIVGDVINGLISKFNAGENEVKEHIIHDKNAARQIEDNQCLKVKKKSLNSFEAVIPLPTGTELVNIAGVDLPKEDVGNALQFLEFIATFGKILDVKKGQAEVVLRDLIKGRSTRHGKFTSVTQFHIQLLSVIHEESELSPTSDLTYGNDSWLIALKSCISKSKLKHVDLIGVTSGGYANLDSSMKLRLLVFLCDEVLGTEKVRNWIDDQNGKLSEKRKEAKDKLSIAKDKEKSLKQLMQDDIAKAIIAKEGVPLSIKEHDAIVSKIKDQAAEAHAEMLACKTMVPIDTERPDAVRTEPIFSDNNGHVYWRLKGCSEKPGILQDIGTGDHTVESVDKWFEYDDEQMDLIEKHINVLRSRYRKY